MAQTLDRRPHNFGGMQAYSWAIKLDLGSHSATNFGRNVDIANARTIVQRHGLVGQKTRNHHLGSSVFGTANLHLTAQSPPARNVDNTVHDAMIVAAGREVV